MKLTALTHDVLARAIAIYQELAYGQGKRRVVEPPPGGGHEALLAMFTQEQAEAIPGHPCCRYALRLGNRNYPFMKLVLQEHLLPGEYYFAVDTHDQMEIKPDYPDYEPWRAVQRFNRELKAQIERGFDRAGLDTASALRKLLVDGGAGDGGLPCPGLVLVVDDEEDLAAAVEALFARRGWRVVKVHDGAAAVAAVQALRPDLVLLDYELPELDGLQVIERLRADAATKAIPVLLSSAARVSLADIQRADGFLAKPFPETLLFDVVDRVLRTRGVAK